MQETGKYVGKNKTIEIQKDGLRIYDNGTNPYNGELLPYKRIKSIWTLRHSYWLTIDYGATERKIEFSSRSELERAEKKLNYTLAAAVGKKMSTADKVILGGMTLAAASIDASIDNKKNKQQSITEQNNVNQNARVVYVNKKTRKKSKWWIVLIAIFILYALSRIIAPSNNRVNNSSYTPETESYLSKLYGDEYICKSVGEIFEEYGTDYTIGTMISGNYIEYNNSDFIFFYDAEENDKNYTPEKDNKIFQVQTRTTNAKINKNIQIGYTLDQIEKTIGQEITCELDKETNLYVGKIMINDITYALVFSEENKELIAAVSGYSYEKFVQMQTQ